ncbi:TetR family transcriptional regulator [Dactylosporangium vinaceum]|uniref:TetR family transcriptional regulator n=1 Tax=Dactylosporangium vinaceum TaxID=53362 RepID=A0ABV5MMK2_9ACTN|nr:TetR family transcriptional regulator [Dactylosporangium vinaceum]UAB93225.1 TetR family transcriptional regulator [Dactylosporangium vinaceum]
METGAVSTSRERTRARIVEVAARLLREQGAAAVTVRAVAQEAGLQAPTIYRFFEDKDALLDAVAEHVLATYVADKARTASLADPVEDLRAGWRTQIEFGLANGALFTLMSDLTRTRPSPAAEAGYEVLRARVHRIAAAGRLRVPEDRAIALLRAAGNGAVLTILATPPEDRDPTLADDMLTAVLGVLLNDAPAVPPDDATALAVAFRAVVPTLPTLTPAERSLLGEWLTR